MIHLDGLKHQGFDHTRGLDTMSAKQILEEYLYLKTGLADERAERKGVKLGLPPALVARLGVLEGFITKTLEHHLSVPA